MKVWCSPVKQFNCWVDLNFKPISGHWIKFDELSVYSKVSSILILNSYLEVCKDVWRGRQRMDWHLRDDEDHQVHLQHDGTPDRVSREARQRDLQEDGQVTWVTNIVGLEMCLAFRNADGKVTQDEFVQTCLGKLFCLLEFKSGFIIFFFSVDSKLCSMLNPQPSQFLF